MKELLIIKPERRISLRTGDINLIHQKQIKQHQSIVSDLKEEEEEESDLNCSTNFSDMEDLKKRRKKRRKTVK